MKSLTRQYFKVLITETGRDNLKSEASIFNEIKKTFKTLDEAKQYLIDRYGLIPKRKPANIVYRDVKGGQGVPVGFLRSFWNKDWSHNSPHWFQTDWIEVSTVTESPVMVN